VTDHPIAVTADLHQYAFGFRRLERLP